MTFEERKRLVGLSYEAWGKGDLDTLFSIYHADCEFDNTRLGLPDIPPVSRGHGEMAEFRRVSLDMFPDVFPVAQEVIDAPGDRVLVVGTWQARNDRGRLAALAAVPAFGQIIEFQDGLLRRIEFFPDPAEARLVAGVS